MDQPEVLFPDTACQKACGPYAGEACRKDMHQEPAYEFIRVKFHGLPCIGRAAVILVPEADTVVIKALHPVVGDGCPVGIPGKVGDGIIRVLTSGIMRIAYRCEGFDLHVPFRPVAGIYQFLPCVGVPVSLRLIEVREPVLLPELFEAVQELPPEEPVYRFYRKEEPVGRAALKIFLTGCQPSSGDQHVQVVVEGEVGSETVKDRQDARSHPRFVLRQGQDRVLGGTEQEAQGLALVLVHDLTEIMGQCEHKMEVGNARDHFRLAQGHPAPFIQVAAAGAVAVPAGTGPHFNAAAVITADQGISELPRFAGDQGIHYFQFPFRDRMGLAVLREMCREEIPKLMLFTVIRMGIRLQEGPGVLRGDAVPRTEGLLITGIPGTRDHRRGFQCASFL